MSKETPVEGNHIEGKGRSMFQVVILQDWSESVENNCF